MINNILKIKVFHNETTNVSYIKYDNDGYEIHRDQTSMIKHTTETLDSTLLLNTFNNSLINNICDFDLFLKFIKSYIEENKHIAINEIMDSFNVFMFKKDFILNRPKCFSQKTKLIKIKKNNDREYLYYFKHENERFGKIVIF